MNGSAESSTKRRIFTPKSRGRIRFEARTADLQNQLAYSEALYRTTFDSLVDCVIIQDEDGRILSMNKSAKTLLGGYMDSNAPKLGEQFAAKIPEVLNADGTPLDKEDRPAIKALATGEPVVGQEVLIRKQGAELWFKCNATPSVDEESGRRRVVVAFTDITQERALELRLAEEQALFSAALENAPIGMAIVSANGHFRSVNESLCKLLGRSEEELLALTFQELTHPDDLELDLENVTALIDGERDSYRIRKRYLSPTGEEIPTILVVAAIRPDSTLSEPYFISQIVGEE